VTDGLRENLGFDSGSETLSTLSETKQAIKNQRKLAIFLPAKYINKHSFCVGKIHSEKLTDFGGAKSY